MKTNKQRIDSLINNNIEELVSQNLALFLENIDRRLLLSLIRGGWSEYSQKNLIYKIKKEIEKLEQATINNLRIPVIESCVKIASYSVMLTSNLDLTEDERKVRNRLKLYTSYIQDGEGNTVEAKELRVLLEKVLGKEHKELKRCNDLLDLYK